MYSGLRKRKEPKVYSKRYYSPNDYFGLTHNRLSYFDNLKKELEARHSQAKNKLFRKHAIEGQYKTNYRNELERIKQHLRQNETRLPIGTIETLKKKEEDIKKIIKEISM